MQGVLQRAPDAVPPGADFSQALCFCEEAAAAEMRRRAAAAAEPGAGGGGHGIAAALDSVAEWQSRDPVVLVNDGKFVRQASGGRVGEGGPSVRPTTAVVD